MLQANGYTMIMWILLSYKTGFCDTGAMCSLWVEELVFMLVRYLVDFPAQKSNKKIDVLC